MIETTHILIVAGGFAGGFLNGLSGFGTGLAAMPFWLSAVSPALAAQLAAAGGAFGNLQSIHLIINEIKWRHVGHFIVAGLIGVPIGTLLLPFVPEKAFKLSVGVFLLVFCSVMLAIRGRIMLFRRRPLGDIAAGLIGGLMSGIAGLSGPVPTAWATLHDWSRDEKRALFQTFNLTILTATLFAMLLSGLMTRSFLPAVALAIPGVAIGNWIGRRLYVKLNARRFDALILAILGASGLVLIWNNL